MGNIKKRQHYVWRRYLRAWTNDENIWTYFKQLNRIERPGLMGVAQERYFYKMSDFSNEEDAFLKSFIENLSPTQQLKEFNLEYFSMFTITNSLKKWLTTNKGKFVDSTALSEQLRELEINIIEDAHCKIEDLGIKLINYRSIDELRTIHEEDYVFEAVLFLCVQYFRTKNIKNSALKKFKGTKHESVMEKSWNIISYALSTILTKSIALNPDLKFIFYKNQTSDHFITGDQPVFNILNDELNDKGEVADLELYYPLSPNHAIKLYFDSNQSEQFLTIDADRELINYLNKRVVENSDFYVFADSKEQLENLNIFNPI